MSERMFSELVIIGYRDASVQGLDDLRGQQQVEIIDYHNFCSCSGTVPEHLKSIKMMCFNKEVDIFDNKLQSIMVRSGQRVKNIKECNYLHQFVLTDGDGERRFCTSIVVYQRCRVIVSNLDDLVKQQIEEQEVYLPFAYCIISAYCNLVQQKQLITSLYQCLFDQEQYSQICVMDGVKMSHGQLFEFYVSVIGCIPRYSNKMIRLTMPTNNNQSRRQEQTSNVLLQLIPYSDDILQSQYQVSYNTLYKQLSIHEILIVLSYILLEKQIIIFTDQVWELANLTQALLSLIHPFQWRCIYIPYLPSNMLETLHATTPYIIGVNRNHMNSILQSIDSQDKLLIDLNQAPNHKLSLTTFQFHYQAIIASSIQASLTHPFDHHQFQSVLLKHQMLILHDFIPYFTYAEQEDFKKLQNIFNKDQYLRIFPQDQQDFYQEFVLKTMIFQRFLEDAYTILYVTQFQANKYYNPHSQIASYLKLHSLIQFNQQPHLQFITVQNKLKKKINHLQSINQQIQEISLLSLYPYYLNKLNSKQHYTQKPKYPITSFNHSNIVQMPELFHKQSKTNNQQQSQQLSVANYRSDDIGEENTTLLDARIIKSERILTDISSAWNLQQPFQTFQYPKPETKKKTVHYKQKSITTFRQTLQTTRMNREEGLIQTRKKSNNNIVIGNIGSTRKIFEQGSSNNSRHQQSSSVLKTRWIQQSIIR